MYVYLNIITGRKQSGCSDGRIISDKSQEVDWL